MLSSLFAAGRGSSMQRAALSVHRRLHHALLRVRSGLGLTGTSHEAVWRLETRVDNKVLESPSTSINFVPPLNVFSSQFSPHHTISTMLSRPFAITVAAPSTSTTVHVPVISVPLVRTLRCRAWRRHYGVSRRTADAGEIWVASAGEVDPVVERLVADLGGVIVE